ncbi:outer membrane protein transport protein [Sulfurimonas sp.]|uniref:OmpP1/FadL family transporter n=1 Tax=Sulfurimonas sp. TaxID=2022749 RepID=UPI00260BCCC1|nr:outer membrane protein transport protein [Sulfurimonas sp.]MCW8896165.1 outer membrane protein transport protein [Sulfurimonas sp.]
MKRTIKLAVVAALALGATSAFATNGSTMIGIGAKSRAMGGVGIATGFGAESGINNPALITTIKGDNEVSFGGTVFMPDIEVQASTTNLPSGSVGAEQTSDSDFFVIPTVSLASKINDNWYWGIGMWGTGGLGVDYRDVTENTFSMVTALQTMQFGLPIAYTNSGFSIGVTPIVQYSSLDIQYTQPADFIIPGDDGEIGSGVAQDIALGLNLGVAYETDGLTFGAMYKSEIKFDTKDVMNTALDGFGVGPSSGGTTINEMATPAEMGVGVSYTMNEHTVALDYKNINWEDAEGYKDFGWEDQDVIAIGYEYATDGWALRAGYQYAESAVQDNSGKNLAIDATHATAMAGMGITGTSLTNTFNLLGFPGTQESHISFGGTYAFNETLSMDLAVVYGLENTETFKGFTGEDIKSTHSEQSYSVQVNYAF